MGRTPEAIVKDEVKKIIREFTEQVPITSPIFTPDAIKAFWPVQNGMGSPSLDCLICYRGLFIAIETKAPGKKPTPRQETTIAEYRAAGAIVLVIDGEKGYEELRQALNLIKWSHANDRQQQA